MHTGSHAHRVAQGRDGSIAVYELTEVRKSSPHMFFCVESALWVLFVWLQDGNGQACTRMEYTVRKAGLLG
jgi:hypothetical protein